MAWRAGAAVVLRSVGEGGDVPAGLGACIGDGHGVGVVEGGVAPAPAHRAGEGETDAIRGRAERRGHARAAR